MTEGTEPFEGETPDPEHEAPAEKADKPGETPPDEGDPNYSSEDEPASDEPDPNYQEGPDDQLPDEHDKSATEPETG